MKYRVLAGLFALLLPVLHCLHTPQPVPEIPMMVTAAVEYLSVNSDFREELKIVCQLQADEATGNIYFGGDYILVIASMHPRFDAPVTVVQEQETGEPVTVTADYILYVDQWELRLESPSPHEHDPHQFKPEVVFPPDRNHRRLKFFA